MQVDPVHFPPEWDTKHKCLMAIHRMMYKLGAGRRLRRIVDESNAQAREPHLGTVSKGAFRLFSSGRLCSTPGSV